MVVETERVAELDHVEVLALGKAETVLTKVVAQLRGAFDDLTTMVVVFLCVWVRMRSGKRIEREGERRTGGMDGEEGERKDEKD